jgi:hypothetical protein
LKSVAFPDSRRSRPPHRRHDLRPADHGRTGGAGLAGRMASSQMPRFRCRTLRRWRKLTRCWRPCRIRRWRSSTVWRWAPCRSRRPIGTGCGWSGWCIIRWRWKPAWMSGSASSLYASEREALRQVRQVIVTSPSTARALADYDIPLERARWYLPGVDPAPLATGSNSVRTDVAVRGQLTPRKGHAVLFRALAQLRHHPLAVALRGQRRRS